MNPLHALNAPCLLTFLSNLSNTEEVALVANLVAKRTARRSNTFYLDYLTF